MLENLREQFSEVTLFGNKADQSKKDVRKKVQLLEVGFGVVVVAIVFVAVLDIGVIINFSLRDYVETIVFEVDSQLLKHLC